MLRLGQTCRRCKKRTDGCRKCTGCDIVWYCSKDCQRDDWESHKQNCSKSQEATADDWSKLKCRRCDQWKPNLKRCTGCHVVYYCSKECQTRDWGDHKVTCKETKQTEGPDKKDNKDTELKNTGPCEACKKPGCKLQCAKCKESYYCSKECQRQDWKKHKATKCKVQTPNNERTQSVPEETGEKRFSEFSFSFGPSGMPIFREGSPFRPPEMTRMVAPRPPGSLDKAKAIIQRRFFLSPIVDDLDEVEVENPFAFFRGLQKDESNYVFVAFMFQYHEYGMRHAIFIKDRKDEVTRVEFYLDFDNPFPFFSYNQVKPGNYIGLLNPLIHHFRDGTVGIRVDDPSEVTIIDGRSVT